MSLARELLAMDWESRFAFRSGRSGVGGAGASAASSFGAQAEQ
jgi:hypothetical protein